MERQLVTGKRKVEIGKERAGRAGRATGAEGDKWIRSWAWGKATICDMYCSRLKPERNRWLYSVLIPRQDYSSFQESRVFPRDLRLISGIQNLSALLSAKTNVTTYQSICHHPPSSRHTQTAAASCLSLQVVEVWPNRYVTCKVTDLTNVAVLFILLLGCLFAQHSAQGRRTCRIFKSGTFKQNLLN